MPWRRAGFPASSLSRQLCSTRRTRRSWYTGTSWSLRSDPRGQAGERARGPLTLHVGQLGGCAWNLDDLLLNGVLNQLRLIVDIQFAHQIKFVRLHGLDAQVQAAGDLFDGVAFARYLQPLLLARTQCSETPCPLPRFPPTPHVLPPLRQHART